MTLFNLLIGTPAIGQCFLLIKPTAKPGQALHQDMPILEVYVTMLPLKDQFMQSFPIGIPKAPTLVN
jgi:hypothetical protein